jgi:hypothetical protein
MSETRSDTLDRSAAPPQRRHVPGPVTSEALSRLKYLLDRPLGCGAVLGPARSGKSRLMRTLAAGCQRHGAMTAFVDGQGLDARGLNRELAAAWRIGTAAETQGRRLAEQLRDFLQGALASRLRLAIVLDHADRLEHTGAVALSRLLHEAEWDGGLTLLWAAAAPPCGDAAEVLLPFTELRLDCPEPTPAETADFARDHWQRTGVPGASEFPAELAGQFADLSRGDLRRAERLARLSRLAALAEGTPLNADMLEAVARELA